MQRVESDFARSGPEPHAAMPSGYCHQHSAVSLRQCRRRGPGLERDVTRVSATPADSRARRTPASSTAGCFGESLSRCCGEPTGGANSIWPAAPSTCETPPGGTPSSTRSSRRTGSSTRSPPSVGRPPGGGRGNAIPVSVILGDIQWFCIPLFLEQNRRSGVFRDRNSDLKSCGAKAPCGSDPRPRHQIPNKSADGAHTCGLEPLGFALSVAKP
jgi:hypothetical protein